jgi:hypothetical protein
MEQHMKFNSQTAYLVTMKHPMVENRVEVRVLAKDTDEAARLAVQAEEYGIGMPGYWQFGRVVAIEEIGPVYVPVKEPA